jgi:hypothetical protein
VETEEIAAVEAELRGRRPSRHTVAHRVTRPSQLSGSAGAFASAGTDRLDPRGALSERIARLLTV